MAQLELLSTFVKDRIANGHLYVCNENFSPKLKGEAHIIFKFVLYFGPQHITIIVESILFYIRGHLPRIGVGEIPPQRET
jgi:hypothetical protein